MPRRWNGSPARVRSPRFGLARPFRSECANGNVYLVAGPWNQAFIDELCAFPKGSNDDQVDGASGAYNWLVENQAAGDLVVG